MRPSSNLITLTFSALFFLSFLISCTASNQDKEWKGINSVEEVCQAYPDRMKSMLESLNLDLPKLQGVKDAYEANNIVEACELLLEYYKTGESNPHLRTELPIETSTSNPNADTILQDIYTFQTVTGKVPRNADEQLKWNHNGPEDDIEWAWALNRHYPVTSLLSAYSETGNAKYIHYIDDFIKDWIIQSAPYPAVKSGTAMWRGLEVSFRVKVWSKVFYMFINSDYISPATELLILSAIPDHAHYARNFHGHTNWLTMEMSGLATAASAWPEYKKSKEYMDYTLSAMTESLKEQIYPDGTQTELTTHYHRVALVNFYLYYTICQKANISLPKYFTDEIEKMWNYLALVMRPDGNALLNNDSDLDYNKERIYDVAKDYKRDDWLYVATNEKEGTPPSNGPSFIFPYAGHLISRSGYKLEDHWSFFDIGPWGSGHQHNDKLHLSISAFGKDFLVDAGRFAYKGEVAEKFRGYAKSSAGHNVLVIDNHGQMPGPKLTESAIPKNQYIITPEFDYASESFNQYEGLEGTSKHTRALLYVRDEFWVVVDKIETDRPRNIKSLWHWHPQCDVQKLENNKIVGRHSGGQLTITPVGDNQGKVDFISGQETPKIQGWYSKKYNQYVPNTASIYSTDIDSDEVFVWLIKPSKLENEKVQAKVISQNDEAVQLEVINSTGGTWNLNIPFSNSATVSSNLIQK